MSIDGCKFCGKKGVLIYPVRYAVACPAGAGGVPGLSGNFKVVGGPGDIAPAKYTLRSLRNGFLYTYDEKRFILKAYMVCRKGFLWNFEAHKNPPTLEQATFSCLDRPHIAIARCVDIIHDAAHPATNFWIGWSNSQWTKRLIDKVKDAAWRKRHMQCINIPAMIAGTASHTAEFKSGHQQIAHFAANGEAMRKAFGFSNQAVDDEDQLHFAASNLSETFAKQDPFKKGFVVALNDPVGITNDLSELTSPTCDAGFDEVVYRGKVIYDILHSTKTMLQQHAHQTVVRHYDPNAFSEVSITTGWMHVFAKSPTPAQKAAEKRKLELEAAAEAETAERIAWEEVSSEHGRSLLDEERIEKFPEVYERALGAFAPVHEKLSNAHVAWLCSGQLAEWMEGVHDIADIRSGFAYSESLT